MNPQTHSQNVNVQQPGAGIGLDDIYFTVFRHKKILLACLCLGLLGVVVVHFTARPLYSSQAKLQVSYVLERRDIDPVDQGANIINPGSDSVLNTETEFLSSLDLATEVATNVGPEKILAMKGGGTDVMNAAVVVRAGIMAYSPRRSDVMYVSFFHPDSRIVQPVLEAIIHAYLRIHIAVRQGTLFGESYYSEQLVGVRKKLADTEEELKKVLTDARVLDIKEAKVTYSTRIEKLKGDLLDAKGQLYARKAALGEDPLSVGSTNSLESSIPADKWDYYATVLAGLKELNKRERELLLQYRDEHPQVSATRERVAELKKKKAELEQEHPGLALNDGGPAGFDVAVERAQIRSLANKVQGYEDLLADIQDEALNLLTIEPKIAELERQREQEAKNFAHVSSSLDRARVDEVGGSNVRGINVYEKPTPPSPDKKKIRKMMLAVFGGFMGLGLGFAALMDFVIDRTIKRSADVRRHMRLPFFLAIPNTCWDGRIRLPGLPFRKPPPGELESENGTNGAVTTVMPPWDSDHHLRVYAEGLRERLITYFEVNHIDHKPKLVGVTSCGEGAGVTTLASGVAAALSKTGDGNVLLVDMNASQGATHSFYKGKPGCGLADALEPEARADAQVQENLYLVSLRPSETPGVNVNEEASNRLLPSRFNKIMPQLKASDYDYVIFDMPPVTPTSVTPRLASNMDMVLLVIESEKTAQQTAGRASTLLADAHAKASVVLNKCRQHVPAMLSEEL